MGDNESLVTKGQGAKNPDKHPVTKCQRGGGPPDDDSVLWTHRSQIIPTFQDTSEVVLQSNIPVFKCGLLISQL